MPTVTVQVTDCNDSSKRIQGATLTDGSFTSPGTNSSGEVTISFPYDDYVVMLSAPGYQTVQIYLSETAGGPLPECLSKSGGGAVATSTDGCFIVTATTGSDASEQIIQLRALRERVFSLSPLSARLAIKVAAEYYQFSPAIAADLERDAIGKTVALTLAVRPLIAWYALACALALDAGDQAAVEAATKAFHAARPPALAMNGLGALLEAIRSGSPLPYGVPEGLQAYLPKIRQGASLPFVNWFVLDPLVRLCSLEDERADVADEISQWLARAPLAMIDAPDETPDDLDSELRTLAAFFNFSPKGRVELGRGLLAAWPAARDSLARHGFL
jgi:hypothetical protein